MEDHSAIIEQQLDQVKEFLSNFLLLLEQSLQLDDPRELERRIELNRRIDQLMHQSAGALGQLNASLSAAEQAKAELAPELRQAVSQFLEHTPSALQALQTQLTKNATNLAAARDQIKEQLLKIQQSQKGYLGYKTATRKNPRMLDSTI